MTTTHCHILYADDDTDDQQFLYESLATSGLAASMTCVNNGEEAIAFLEHAPATELPALIILDLNMPRLNGRQTLDHLKARPDWARIPVIILTTSDSATESSQCRQSGAASYLTKPQHLRGYDSLVQQFKPYVTTLA